MSSNKKIATVKKGKIKAKKKGRCTVIAKYNRKKYNQSDWEYVTRKDSMVTANALLIAPHSTTEFESGLSNYFTDLSSGQYRLSVQTSYGKICSEEFIIE